MRSKLCVGILRETRAGERRAPVTPAGAKWLIKHGIRVEVESCPVRIFADSEYKRAGAKVVNRFQKASLLLGIKEPRIFDLYPDKIYMLFSHTSKGQSYNMPLLKSCLENNITLIDYEKITDLHEKRLVYFGRFAGVCGFVDSLHYLGKRLAWEGIKTPFLSLNPSNDYASLDEIKKAMAKVDEEIYNRGFKRGLSPFIIGITGHGNVSRGVHEVFEFLNPVEIHPQDIAQFIKHQKGMRKEIYKIVFLREEKFRSKKGKKFYFEEYMESPGKYESNLDKYLPHINMLINGSYWESRYPRLVTVKMINRLSKKRDFRLKFIADIACDIDGSIELTHKATTQDNPTFTYNTKEKRFIDGYKSGGITMLAVDNLPSELPRDASREFNSLIRDYVFQIATHGSRDITRHKAVPEEARKAVIAQGGRLTKNFKYLAEWVK